MGYEKLLDVDYDVDPTAHMAQCDECRAAVGIGAEMAAAYQKQTTSLEKLREERGARYGDVRLNHASIGAIWSGILLQAMSAGRWEIGQAMPPELVCLMMVGVKLSREAYRHTEDNIDDAKNYMDFVEELS